MRLPVQFSTYWDTPREFSWRDWDLVGKLFADKVKNKLRETNLLRDKVNEMTKKELRPLFNEAAAEVFATNKWQEDWRCEGGYTELTAELGIDETGGGVSVGISCMQNRRHSRRYKIPLEATGAFFQRKISKRKSIDDNAINRKEFALKINKRIRSRLN